MCVPGMAGQWASAQALRTTSAGSPWRAWRPVAASQGVSAVAEGDDGFVRYRAILEKASAGRPAANCGTAFS
jgi:hypothetical protein